MKKIYLLFILSTLIMSCGNKDQSQTKNNNEDNDPSIIKVTQEQFNAMNMKISPLIKKDFDSVVNASGKVDVPPQKKAKVSSFISGFVKSSSLLIGDRVEKGQALIELENPEYIDIQKNYLETVSQLSYLKSEYERQKTLFNEKIASQKRYLEAENDYKIIKANYEGLRKKLTMLNINPKTVEQGELVSTIIIYAPISGEITSINTNVGMAITPTDIIMEVVDTKALYLELSVFEKDFFSIKEGQTIKFTIPQVSDNEFISKVYLIGKSVKKTNRVINVYGSLTDSVRKKLLTGMFVEAKIITNTREALCVPYDALVSEENSKYLLILESEENNILKFRKTFIDTGDRNGDWIEIILNDNVNISSKILVKGAYDVL